jgi:glutamine amidotransferase
VPDVRELTLTLRELAAPLAKHGPFNFLLSNGQALWAHCSTNLFHVERRHPFTHAQLKDEDVSVDFARHTTPQDKVAVVVTAPLTVNEEWRQMRAGELRVFLDGQALP